jgi:hypothetical protein
VSAMATTEHIAFQGPYLQIVRAGTSASGKTLEWDVLGRSHGAFLGEIRWYGPWRQYCFMPCSDTVFNHGCLADIAAFLVEQNRTHKAPPA